MSQNVHVEFTSDHEKVMRGLQKQNAGLQKSVDQLRKINREGKKASKSVGKIGGSAFAALAQFGSLRAAIMRVNAALQQQVQLRREAAGRIESQESSRKRLLQISGGDPEKLAGFERTAATLVRQQGFSVAEAQELTFAGISTGFTNEQIVKMGNFKKFAKDIKPLIEGVAGIQKVFGAGALGGTPESIISASLIGARESKVSVEQLLAEVLKPGKSIRRLGGTAAETLAATAVATITTKSPELAATEVARLADVLGTKKQFKGQSFSESLKQLSLLSGPQQEKLIGKNLRAQRGVDALLNNLPLFLSILAKVKAGAISGPQSMSQRLQRLSESDPILRGLSGKQRARESSHQTSEDIEGPRQLTREAVVAVLQELMERTGQTPITKAQIDFQLWLREAFGLRAEGVIGRSTFGRHAYTRFQELLEQSGYTLDPSTGRVMPLQGAATGDTPASNTQADETNRLLDNIDRNIEEGKGSLVVSGEPLE